ncbi:MAG: hypothetical protein JXR03_16345 [Cyclobacteriaceae bacterium]
MKYIKVSAFLFFLTFANVISYGIIRSQGTELGISLNLLELPFLAASVISVFLVLAVHHLYTQVGHHFKYHLFNHLLGKTSGTFIMFIALAITWKLSALDSYQIWKANKS